MNLLNYNHAISNSIHCFLSFLFRALFVDNGGALIPWMGDPNQPIDRYDGRATIHDLRPYESQQKQLDPKEYLTYEEVSLYWFL